MSEKLEIRNKADIDRSLPLISIIGRPNVGKSTLFNRLIGERRAITDPTPGVTRDPIPARYLLGNHPVTLVDSGGVKLEKEGLDYAVSEKSLSLMEISDLILFVLECTELTGEDMMLIEELRPYSDKVILVINKVDDVSRYDLVWNFFSYGYQRVVGISAAHGTGFEELEDTMLGMLSLERVEQEPEEPERIKLAILGKPNTGKSTLTNLLTGRDISIVSEIAGTTRDSVLIPFKYDKKQYALIDTAGLRRSRSVEKQSIEGYSVLRTMSAINDADVVLIVVDGSCEKLTEQDVRIAGYVHEAGKPSVIVVNKWDIKSKSKERFEKTLKIDLSFMSYFQTIYVSAMTGSGLGQIMELAQISYENSSKRITTGLLNNILQDAVLNFEPPSKGTTRAKIKYITQSSVCPPTFVLFVNDADLITPSYERYLENRFRERMDLRGTPIKFIIKGKGEE